MPNSFEKYFFEKFFGMAGLDMFREVLKQIGGIKTWWVSEGSWTSNIKSELNKFGQIWIISDQLEKV